jgi:GAF domain
LHNPWLALEVGADPQERSAALRLAHLAFVTSGMVPARVRGVVADSWRRSARLVGPEAIAPVDLADAELEAYRSEHPLARVMPLLRDLLGTIAHDGAHLLAVCDADGLLLWVEGHAGVRKRVEGMNFVAGARWDEVHAGTSAPGVALATDHAVQIFGAEHFSRVVQPWTCAAAPIHDPETGEVLGAVDITGGYHLASPQSLALVQATARAAEAELATLRPGPSGPGTGARLRALGRDEAILEVGGVRHRLGRRHSEILVLLAAHPEGLSNERLAWELYGERLINPVTLRAELSRLRQLLGRLFQSRPYRLTEPMSADFSTVTDQVRSGSVGAALRTYAGPLLPGSGSPGILRLRRQLDDLVRDAVLRAGDYGMLERWATSPSGEDDLEAWESLLAGTPAGSRRHVRVAARAANLRRDFVREFGPAAATAFDDTAVHGDGPIGLPMQRRPE